MSGALFQLIIIVYRSFWTIWSFESISCLGISHSHLTSPAGISSTVHNANLMVCTVSVEGKIQSFQISETETLTPKFKTAVKHDLVNERGSGSWLKECSLPGLFHGSASEH